MKKLLFSLIMLLGCSQVMRAQDTIDTNYYRYAHNPIANVYMDYYFAYDSTTDANVIIDSSNYCPNGFGFWRKAYFYNSGIRIPIHTENLTCYAEVPMGRARYVHGFAVMMDSVQFLSDYDTLFVRLCVMSDDSSHMVVLDSVSLTKNTVGIKRYMALPIILTDPTTGGPIMIQTQRGEPLLEPLEDCIDHIDYTRVVEIFFDEPVELDNPNKVYVNLRATDGFADRLFIPVVDAQAGCNRTLPFYYNTNEFGVVGASAITYYYKDNCHLKSYRGYWYNIFPIIAVLPDWENDRMDSVFLHWENVETPHSNGIRSTMSPIGLNVYPNPASNAVSVVSDDPIALYRLYDMTGRLVLYGSPDSHSASLDVSALRPGLYHLQITTPTSSCTRKIQVLH